MDGVSRGFPPLALGQLHAGQSHGIGVDAEEVDEGKAGKGGGREEREEERRYCSLRLVMGSKSTLRKWAREKLEEEEEEKNENNE